MSIHVGEHGTYQVQPSRERGGGYDILQHRPDPLGCLAVDWDDDPAAAVVRAQHLSQYGPGDDGLARPALHTVAQIERMMGLAWGSGIHHTVKKGKPFTFHMGAINWTVEWTAEKDDTGRLRLYRVTQTRAS